MKKVVEYLSYGEAAYKDELLPHITEMVHHEILPKETFKEHFNGFLKKYENKPEYHKAIQEFIANQPDDVLSMVPWDAYEFGDPEGASKQWHSFNIFDVRTESTK